MSLKNKIRNIRMFGIKQYLPSMKYRIILGIIIVGILFLLANSFSDESSNQLTGEIIQNTIIEDNQLIEEKEEQVEEETEEDQIETEEGYEVYEYYEYGGECSYKIGQAEDDVNDIIGYSEEDQTRYNTLKDEYQRKIEELKNIYEHQIENAKEDYDKSQDELRTAQDTLKELQEVCAF